MSIRLQGSAIRGSRGSRHGAAARLLALSCFVALPAFSAPQDDGASKADPQDAPVVVQPMAVDVDPQTALMTVVEPKLEFATSPLDDSYDPATGGVTFATTDVSLPGNFDIPVELGRWVPAEDYDTGGPTGWSWNIPFIRGNYLDVRSGHNDNGWDWGPPVTWHFGKNCTGGASSAVTDRGDVVGGGYWKGKLLHIPGVTSEAFLVASGGQQLTKSNFRIASCIDNASGQQGIVVAGPDGLTYTFNQIKSYWDHKATFKDPVVFTRLLMVTKIEDRFGNHVDYSYSPDDGELTGISASDGRAITINYEISGGSRRPATVVANGRTWSYVYQGPLGSGTDKLLYVSLPDGLGLWKYEGLSAIAFKPNGIGGYNQRIRFVSGAPVLIPGCSTASGDYTVKVTNPSGLLSTYVFRDTVHYRANVEPDIYEDAYDQDYAVSRSINCTVARSLVSKSISGPGIAAAAWNYQYSGNRGTYTAGSGLNGYLTGPFDLPAPAVGGYPGPITPATAVNYRSTTVSGPDKKVVFYIDRQSQSVNESRVVAQDVLNAAGSQLLARSEYTFALGAEVGHHGLDQPTNDYQLTHRINQTQLVEKRYVGSVADTFTTTFGNFDAYGFWLSSQGSNGFSGNVRTLAKTYLHDTANGLIGLPLTEKVNGTTVTEHHYDTLGRRDWTKSFGKLQQTLTYNADGTLATVKDGNNNITTLSNWKRGTPQTIKYPAAPESPSGATRSGTVNDNGWIESITDETGSKTCYAYDAMGRISQVTYPSEAAANTCNTSTWYATTQAFVPVASAEYGIAAGHWRQTVSTGNARKITYFDALWRPLVTREYDTANEAGTQRFQRFAYDHEGRTTFASYPGTTDALSTGTWTDYDALGRVTAVGQDTELSPSLQVTTTQYLTGFQTRVTDPKGNQTTTSYQAFDQPSYDAPVTIAHPASAVTEITRDVFGKPTAIKRRNSANTQSLTRSYTYNANQELCRTVEPETGATLMGYDGAGNLKWSAAGLGSSQACEANGTSSAVAARRVDRTYDARNRLGTLVFPDGQGNQSWTYAADGLPASITTYNATGNTKPADNTYTYNRRRLTTQETMARNGSANWYIDYAYNANGHLARLDYPSSLYVDYAPNALGQPTKAGTFATGVSYYPNGAIKQFTYGNGIVHTMTQNARQLPSRSTDCTTTGTCSSANKRLDLSYAFDANGNVGQITDNTSGGQQTRSMTYDALDRLTGATSPMFGTATYAYDALDNLTRVKLTGGSQVRDHYYCYDTSGRLGNIKTGSCSGATVIGLGYDVQGNLANKSGQTYSFDYGNRLRAVAGKESYMYDGHGRRVQAMTSSSAYVVSQYSQSGQLLYQQDYRKAQREEYIYLGGSLVANRETPHATGSAAVVKYQHTDALGSPIVVTDAGKTVLEQTEYEPYGQVVNGPLQDGPGYTGHVLDAATGLNYMQQRYYDPMIGRFLSRDPVMANPNSGANFNAYLYANNNPYKFTDPDGRQVRYRMEEIARGQSDGCQSDPGCRFALGDKEENKPNRSENSGTLNDGKRKFAEGTEKQRLQNAIAILGRVGATVREHRSNSSDDAAKYFMKVFQPVSTKFGVEISAEIKGGSGGWYLTNLGVGSYFRRVDGIGFMAPGGIDFGGINSHTHPLEDYSGHWNEPFSTDDIRSLRDARATGYVSTPSMLLFRFVSGGSVEAVP